MNHAIDLRHEAQQVWRLVNDNAKQKVRPETSAHRADISELRLAECFPHGADYAHIFLFWNHASTPLSHLGAVNAHGDRRRPSVSARPDVPALKFWLGNAPEAIGARLRKRSEIARLHGVDAKAALLKERRNVARHVATLEGPLEKRLRAPLPAAYILIRRQPVFKKEKLAAWPQHAQKPGNCFRHARYGAEGERADNG